MVMIALESNDDSFASFGLLIINACLFIVTFNHNSFSHAYRQVNFVAYNLARHARHVNSLFVWMKDAPLHLTDVLLADCVWYLELCVLAEVLFHLSMFSN